MIIYILKITFKTLKANNNIKKDLYLLKKIGNFEKNKNISIFKIKKKKKLFTLLKSPHIYKKSREQFIYENFIVKIEIKFINFIQLLNFILILQKTLVKNKLIMLKIMKKCL